MHLALAPSVRFVSHEALWIAAEAGSTCLPAVERPNSPYHAEEQQACADRLTRRRPTVVNEQAECGCIERLAGNQLCAERPAAGDGLRLTTPRHRQA